MGGTYKGRVLGEEVPKATRPTSDRVREAMASIIEARSDWSEIDVMDLYSGTGAIALECISRGAKGVLAIDAQPKAIHSIKTHAKILTPHDASKLRIQQMDLDRELPVESADWLILDPPYEHMDKAVTVMDKLTSQIRSFALLESNKKPFDHPKLWRHLKTYTYGDTCLHLYQNLSYKLDEPPPESTSI